MPMLRDGDDGAAAEVGAGAFCAANNGIRIRAEEARRDFT